MPHRVGRVVEFVTGSAGATAPSSRFVGARAGRGGDRPEPPELGIAETVRGASLLLDAYDAATRPVVGDPTRLGLLQREWLARARSGDETGVEAVRRTARRWYPADQAERLLGTALDEDDLMLVAEALWLWAVLGLPWRAPATLAMRTLDLQFFARGHVPLTGSRDRHPLPDEGPEAGDRPGSRRATVAYGILCAALWARASEASPRAPIPRQQRSSW